MKLLPNILRRSHRVIPQKNTGAVMSTLATPKGMVGACLFTALILLAFVGPHLYAVSPEDLVGTPFESVGMNGRLFGTDYLGRDTLSRFLHGGRIILVLALLSAMLGVGVGSFFGIMAAYLKGKVSAIILWLLDVLLCFPALVLALLMASLIGTSLPLVLIVVALSHVPRTARVIHAQASQVAERDFIAFTEMLGKGRLYVMLFEILPNLTSHIALELGLRTTWSIGIIASLSFIGLGVQPPLADWGLMINENQSGLMWQPWPVILPVLAICVATIGTNFFTDSYSQKMAGIGRLMDEGKR